MSQSSNSPSPFRDGFAALRHEPALLAAELTWRWCFGLSAWGLGIISIALFLDGLTVAPVDAFLLRTLQPRLLENALRHIFRGSLSRFVLEQTVLLLGVIVLWSLAATAGRAATLRRLVAMFSTEEEPQSMEWRVRSNLPFAAAAGHVDDHRSWPWRSVCSSYGVVMAQDGHPMRAALALSAGLGVPFLAIVLNWFFGVAPLFCIRNGADAMEALEQAVDFAARHAGRLFLLAVGFLCSTAGLDRDDVAGISVAAELDQSDRRPRTMLLMAIVALATLPELICCIWRDWEGMFRWRKTIRILHMIEPASHRMRINRQRSCRWIGLA